MSKHATIIPAINLCSTRITQALSSIKQCVPSNSLTPKIDDLARQLLFRLLSNISQGQLIIVETYDNNHHYTFGDAIDGVASSSEMAGNHYLQVTLYINQPSVYRKVLTGGTIALADSYIDKEWDTDDLTGLIRIAVRNQSVLAKLDDKFGKITNLYEMAKHKLRHNSVENAKANILAHYDISNDMYQTFLDESMMYSSGVYRTPNDSLAQAQQCKLQTLCDLLDLQPSDTVIEIGTGWGGFAMYAAKNYGCHVTTTTISDAQYDEAKKRIEEAGLCDKITLLKQDYRQLTGSFDKLMSIEMVEAVGYDYLDSFFKTCSNLLKPDGVMVMQAITFVDQYYTSYINSVDFIQSHIFPGGCLLSNQEIVNQLTDSTDMVMKSLHDYGYDYAYTLRDWRHAFNKNISHVQAMGFDDSFIRLWEYYFAYCEGGFLEKSIGLVHVRAEKPAYR